MADTDKLFSETDEWLSQFGEEGGEGEQSDIPTVYKAMCGTMLTDASTIKKYQNVSARLYDVNSTNMK